VSGLLPVTRPPPSARGLTGTGSSREREAVPHNSRIAAHAFQTPRGLMLSKTNGAVLEDFVKLCSQRPGRAAVLTPCSGTRLAKHGGAQPTGESLDTVQRRLNVRRQGRLLMNAKSLVDSWKPRAGIRSRLEVPPSTAVRGRKRSRFENSCSGYLGIAPFDELLEGLTAVRGTGFHGR
jgi:hypothetical protein